MFYDKKETVKAATRERGLFKKFQEVLAGALPHAPALQKQLKGVDISSLKTRKDLSKIPVLHKSDLIKMQQEAPPFAGLLGENVKSLKRLLVSPGPIFDPEGTGKDWWGAGRAAFAAGFRKGDIVLNCFSYHLTPGAHIMESGARAIGCPVIPAGVGNTEQQLEAVHFLKPDCYTGTPDFLKILLDKGKELGRDCSSIKKALVSGAAFPPSLQKELEERGVKAYQCYATADLGIIAYESEARGGLIIAENIIVEIVKVGTNEAVKDGEVGEIVVTRLDKTYPLVRFGTGDLSKIIEGTSPCGRTNKRLAGWMGRADQTAKVKGMFVRPEQIQEVLNRHAVTTGRLVIMRDGEQDTMTLRISNGDIKAIAETLQALTKLKGAIEISQDFPNDGKVIEDKRPL